MPEQTKVTATLRFLGSLLAADVEVPAEPVEVAGGASTAVIPLPSVRNPGPQPVVLRLVDVATGNDERFDASAGVDSWFAPVTLGAGEQRTDLGVTMALVSGASDVPGDVNVDLTFEADFA